MSRYHAVHWHEGMFLRPHHFQAAARHSADQLRLQIQWDNHYSWGLRSIDIDVDALRNYRFSVKRLRARMRDGTMVCVPEDGPLAELELKASLTGTDAAEILLAVPDLQLNRKNLGTVAEGDRFRVDPVDGLPDENTGLSGQRVQFRKLNFKLMTGDADPAGYQVLKIAAVTKSDQSGAAPQLSADYIPPVLACEAWPVLTEQILTPIYDRIGQIVKQLSELVREHQINFDSPATHDRQKIEFLRVLNSAYAYMRVTHFASGVHPLTAYAELARLVGELAIFGPEREPPGLPAYDHDDLGQCFWKAKEYIDALLVIEQRNFFKQPFYGASLRIQGDIKPEWLAPDFQMFIGVQTPLKPEQCIELFKQRGGQLNMKIGAADRADEIFRLGERGLEFRYVELPPRVLPRYPDLFYFQVDRAVQQDEWQRVQATLKMAVRFNERVFTGNIDGQRTVSIRVGSQTVPLSFTLYVVPPGLH